MSVVRLQKTFLPFLFLTVLTRLPAAEASKFQVIGYYYPSDGYTVRDILTSGAAPLLTQLDFAFGKVANNQCSVGDPEQDLQRQYSAGESVDGTADPSSSGALRGYFHQLQELKTKYPHLKIVISIGGWTGSGGFSSAAEPAHRAAFVQSCVETFIKGQFGNGLRASGLFDGIDVDWEYPVAGGLQNGKPEDKQNLNDLMAEFRKQMNAVRPGLILSAALPASDHDFANFDLKRLGGLVDQIGLMGYDLHGPGERWTNFHSALFHDPADPSDPQRQSHYVDFAVRAFLNAGVPPNKLILGVPFYGKGYHPVDDTNHGLFRPSGGAAKGEGGYRELKALPATADRRFYKAVGSCTIWNNQTFWSYDCPEAMRLKRWYVLNKGMGGIMFWQIGHDSTDSELLRAIAGK